MNHYHNNVFSIALLLVVALLMHPPAARGDDHPLHMSVEIEPTTIHIYEAVPLTVIFQNTADDGDFFPVHYEVFRMKRGVGVVEVRGPDGVVHILRLLPRNDRSGVPYDGSYWPVQPGEEYLVSFLLSSTDGRKPIFTKSGEYVITIEYEDRAADVEPIALTEFERSDYPDVHLRSEPIAIEVLDPPATERRALKLVKRLQPPIMLYEPNLIPGHPTRPKCENAMRALREIASVEESKIYANYARYSLASRHVRGANAALRRFPSYDIDEEAAAAREMLDAIDTESFTLADRVEALRAELDALVETRDDSD